MKNFFKNLDTAAYNSPIVCLCAVFSIFVFSAFILAIIALGMIKYPMLTISIFIVICLGRIVYAGMTGK